MIHYDLMCGAQHRFDGWFRDIAAFDAQSQNHLLECPICGTATVTRALMAPAVPRKGRSARKPVETAPMETAPAEGVEASVDQSVATAGTTMPAQVRAALQRIRAEVEKNCDYVGPRFADEAVSMHRGEAEKRAIYGETTPEQAEMLADEGVEIASIPWIPRADG